jgi:hypothetical protein
MRLLLVSLFALGMSGCLSVDTPDGSLTCSDDATRACPEGFYCLAPSNRCWRYGHFPEDMAEPGHFMPGGPAEDMSIPVENDLAGDDSGMSTPDDLSQTD